MALTIKNDKVVYVAPPKKLTKKEKKILEETPVNDKLIRRATSRKYNVVWDIILLELKKYTSENSSYHLDIELISSVHLSKDLNQSQREKGFIEDICNRVQKSGTVLYVLRYDKDVLGFIALSVSSIGDFPSLQIDYLFVNNLFRGKKLDFLDGLKTSDYLVDFSIQTAQKIRSIAGLRYVVLLPDNDKLKKVYKKIGFLNLPKQDWLYIKL